MADGQRKIDVNSRKTRKKAEVGEYSCLFSIAPTWRLFAVTLAGNGKLLAALLAAHRQNTTAICSGHTLAEAMLVHSLSVVGLECSFHLVSCYLLLLFIQYLHLFHPSLRHHDQRERNGLKSMRPLMLTASRIGHWRISACKISENLIITQSFTAFYADFFVILWKNTNFALDFLIIIKGFQQDYQTRHTIFHKQHQDLWF